MDKFYVIINEEQQGSFSLNELSKHRIDKNTLIWEEGMNDWEEAQNVPAIKDIINKLPPPYKKGSGDKTAQATTNKPLNLISPPTMSKPKEKSVKWYEESQISTKNYNKIALIGVAGLMLFIFCYKFYDQYRLEEEKLAKKELQLQEDIKVKDSIIQEQKIKEAERLAEEQKKKEEELKQKREEELIQLERELEHNRSLRIQAYNDLEEIRKFQLLRSSSEKALQIANQSNYIASIETEIARLERAIKASQF